LPYTRDAKAAKKIAETYLDILARIDFLSKSRSMSRAGCRESELQLAKVESACRDNDVHFLEKTHHPRHPVLHQHGKADQDDSRLKYPPGFI